MHIVSDSVWNVIKNLLPQKKSSVGRPRLDQKKVFEGIIFIIDSGAQWRRMPKEYGSKSAIHRTFQEWKKAKIFKKIMQEAKHYYFESKKEKCSWLATDTSYSKSPLATVWSGKNPTDRGKRGIKKSIIVDKNGAPLAVHVGAGNTHDSKLLMDTIKELEMNFKTPVILAADSAYDAKILRTLCAKKNIALIASVNKRKNKNRHQYSANNRWIVEQTFGILSWLRGLKICWAKTLNQV